MSVSSSLFEEESTEKRIKDAFEEIDEEGKGSIDYRQLIKAMQALNQNPSEAEMKFFMDKIKKKQEDKFNEEDFMKMAKLMLDENSEGAVKEAFHIFDRHGTGLIPEDKLRELMMCSGERLSEEEYREMMSFMKLDGQGNVQYEEMLSKMDTMHPNTAFQKP